MWSLKRRHPRLSASGSHCCRHLECKGSGQENILLLHLDGHGCRHHWHSRQSTVTPVYWRRVKTEAFRAGEGFVSRIRLENIKSCTDWPTRGSRLAFVQMTAAFQARLGCDACTHWLKEIDATLAVDMRHAAPLSSQRAAHGHTETRGQSGDG